MFTGQADTLLWLLTERAEEALVQFSSDWRYQYLNAAALRLLNRSSSEDLLGKIVWEEYPDLVGSPFHTNGLLAQDERREVTFEAFYAPLSTWFRIRAVPHPASGSIAYLMRDVTPERQRQSQRLLDAGLVGILYWTIEGKVVDANDTFLQMLGYSRDDLLAGCIDWIAITPSELREHDEKPVAELYATGKHLPFEKEYFRKDGSRIPVLVASAFHEGSRTEGVGFVVDIRAQREAQERLRLALVSGGMGTWDADLVERTITFSPEVPPLYGRPREAVTIPVSEWEDSWLHPDDKERVIKTFEAVLQGEPEHGIRFRSLSPDGHTARWIATSALLFRDSNATPVRAVGYTRDVTDEIEREKEREALLARQRQFMRDLVSSLTEGRFRLCASESDLPEPLHPASETVVLELATLRVLRHQVRAAAARLGFSPERSFDLEIAVGEAAMNTQVHGGGNGKGWVCADASRGVLQVWVRDFGKGISEEALPRVLEKGVSTAGTLGHGFSMILKSADRIWLLTGPGGTTVVLEQDRESREPSWLQACT